MRPSTVNLIRSCFVWTCLGLALGCEPPEPVVIERPLMGERSVLTVDMDESLYSWDVRISGTLGVEACRLTLASDLDGRLWSGTPDSSGYWSYQGVMQPGDHQLTFEVVCGALLSSNFSILHLYAVTNRQCVALRLHWMVNGITQGSHCFIADNWDPEDDAILELWHSDVDGGLFEGEEWGMALLSPGEHRIRVDAEDEFGARCSDEVSIEIVDHRSI